MAKESKKCEHPACNCTVTEGSYCSTYCEDAKGTTEIACNCGHGACEVTAGATSGMAGRTVR